MRTYNSASAAGGNQVDGLPPVRNIIRKQLEEKPREDPRKMINHQLKMIELTKFCSMTLGKLHMTCCRAYIED